MEEKCSVALVDDERNILTSLGMALEAEGFDVRTYGDTASAFEALATQPADVAILDYTNRPFNGLELFRRLRALSDMPMIFLSAHAEMLRDLDVGAADYIAKPLSQRLVVERVKDVLRGRRRTTGEGRCG